MSGENLPYLPKIPLAEDTIAEESFKLAIQNLPPETIKPAPTTPEVLESLDFIPFLSQYDPKTNQFPTVLNLVNKNGRVIFSEKNFIQESQKLFETQIAPILKNSSIDYVGKTVRILAPDGGAELEGEIKGRSSGFTSDFEGTKVVLEIIDHHNPQIKESSVMQLFKILCSMSNDPSLRLHKLKNQNKPKNTQNPEILVILSEGIKSQDVDYASCAVLPHLSHEFFISGEMKNLVLESVLDIINEIDVTAGVPNWQKSEWGERVKILIFQWIVFFYSNYYNIHKQNLNNLVGSEGILLNKSKLNLEIVVDYITKQMFKNFESDLLGFNLLSQEEKTKLVFEKFANLNKEQKMDLVINLTLGEGIKARDWVEHLEETGLMLQLQALHNDTEFGDRKGLILAQKRNSALLNPRPLQKTLSNELALVGDISEVLPSNLCKKYDLWVNKKQIGVSVLKSEKTAATKLALLPTDIIIIPRLEDPNNGNISLTTSSIYPTPECLKVKFLIESALNCLYSASTEGFKLEDPIKTHIQFPGALMSGARVARTGGITTIEKHNLATHLAVKAVTLACQDLDINEITQDYLIEYLKTIWNDLDIKNATNLNLAQIGEFIRNSEDDSIKLWLSGV